MDVKGPLRKLLLAVLFFCVIAGCGEIQPGHNTKFAWRVIKCIYGGSLKPLSKHMTSDFENAMTDDAVRELRDTLRQRFGKPKKITFGEPLAEPTGGSTATYVVETKTSVFRMVMTIDESNRISSLDFPDLYQKAPPPGAAE